MFQKHRAATAVLLFTSQFSLAQPNSAPIEIKINPIGMDEATADALTREILQRTGVVEALSGHRYRILRTDFDDTPNDKERVENEPTGPHGRYVIDIYDYTDDKTLRISGGEITEIRQDIDEPAPTPEELEEAVEIIRQDPNFAAVKGHLQWEPYPAMPALIDLSQGNPGVRKERIVSIGLMPRSPSFPHEIVGVNLSRQRVIRFPAGAPPTSMATPRVCAPPNAWQSVTSRGTPGSAIITVNSGPTILWKFNITRPSASSGAWGSGIDIRDVRYLDKRVLGRAHVPILNVLYERNLCGPYRDWSYSENAFEATGTAITSGILAASSPPRTIFESGRDTGNFRGVAVYVDGTDTVLVTELSAGWYRYKNEFRFSADGTIQPRWSFGAVQDSCVCNKHFHHVYWRFDFDISDDYANHVMVFDGATWRSINTEARQYRNDSNQRWRVLDRTQSYGYEIVPGPHDGTADAYGKGDVWTLRYSREQIDDSSVYTGTSANLNAFVNGQSVNNQDSVIWYGAHFIHDHDLDGGDTHIVGPTLRPLNW